MCVSLTVLSFKNLCPEMVYDSPVSAMLALVTGGFYYFNVLLPELPAILLWSFSYVQNAAVCFLAEVSNCACSAVALTACLQAAPLFFEDLNGYAPWFCLFFFEPCAFRFAF